MKPIDLIFPEHAKQVADAVCPSCKGPAKEFRDDISRKERELSGLCQRCQDSVFGGGYE